VALLRLTSLCLSNKWPGVDKGRVALHSGVCSVYPVNATAPISARACAQTLCNLREPLYCPQYLPIPHTHTVRSASSTRSTPHLLATEPLVVVPNGESETIDPPSAISHHRPTATADNSSGQQRGLEDGRG